jgi:hypothetical protein
MYQRYAEAQGWEVRDPSACRDRARRGEGGWWCEVQGEGVFARLKFESGVHRVQRVPVTEAGGRIHTSAATVAVLPEAEEVDFELDEGRSSHRHYARLGRRRAACQHHRFGGAHHPSADRHRRDQFRRSRSTRTAPRRWRSCAPAVRDGARAGRRRARAADRKGAGRLRRPLGAHPHLQLPARPVTDHRINLTLYKLDQVMAGEALAELIDALIAEDQAARLARWTWPTVAALVDAIAAVLRQAGIDEPRARGPAHRQPRHWASTAPAAQRAAGRPGAGPRARPRQPPRRPGAHGARWATVNSGAWTSLSDPACSTRAPRPRP